MRPAVRTLYTASPSLRAGVSIVDALGTVSHRRRRDDQKRDMSTGYLVGLVSVAGAAYGTSIVIDSLSSKKDAPQIEGDGADSESDASKKAKEESSSIFAWLTQQVRFSFVCRP